MSCKECKNSPKTYEEYCIGQSNPSAYCPDAYTEKSYLCGNYEVEKSRGKQMKEDYTEVFYYCNPDKATTCEKRNCYLNGGNCALTTNPMWGKKKVTVDKVHVKPRK